MNGPDDTETEVALRAVIQASPLPIIALDRAGRVLSWNAAAERMLGWTEQEVLSRLLPTVPADEWDEFQALHRQVLQGALLLGVEVRRRKKDGSWIDLSISTAPIYDDTGAVTATMAVYVDITERKRIEQRLIHQALHDALTDLPNRILLSDRLQQAIRGVRRSATSLALLLIDLDRFKDVNDTVGHEVGDRLLQEVAMRLRDVVRDIDTVARLGGDEFAMLLPDTEERGAVLVADKVLQVLAQPFVVEGRRFDVGASIGISLCPHHGRDAPTLLRQADSAMYVAKRAQQGYSVFASDHER